MNWLRNMPRLRFNCLLIYYTASGYRRQSHHRTIASSCRPGAGHRRKATTKR